MVTKLIKCFKGTRLTHVNATKLDNIINITNITNVMPAHYLTVFVASVR